MSATTMVKGVVLRGILKDVKETFPGGIPKFLESLPPAVLKKDFSHNIVHGVWYSYDAFTAALEAYVKVIGGGRAGAIEELGARAARRDLGTLLKIFAVVSSPHRVGQHSTSIWSQRFKDAGVLTMVEKQARSFRLSLEGFPDIHPLNCSFLVGYGNGIGNHWEKTYKVTHDRCIHHGGRECSWISTW